MIFLRSKHFTANNNNRFRSDRLSRHNNQNRFSSRYPVPILNHNQQIAHSNLIRLPHCFDLTNILSI